MTLKKERIYRQEFDSILRSIPDISPKEREYLNKVFSKDLIDGLTKWELKERINKLRYNSNDIIDQWELEKVKNKILSVLN